MKSHSSFKHGLGYKLSIIVYKHILISSLSPSIPQVSNGLVPSFDVYS